MIAPAPTIAPGRRCLIRIVATLIHADGPRGYTVEYLGAHFSIAESRIVERVEKTMALIELDARIIRATGRASFLVAHAGQQLRVHTQQIHMIREVSNG